MTKCKVQINKAGIRRIVIQELQRLHEDVDHEGVANVATVASKMLKATADFKKNANESMLETLDPYVSRVVELLEAMVSNPGAYVVKPTPEPKRITLRQVDSDA